MAMKSSSQSVALVCPATLGHLLGAAQHRLQHVSVLRQLVPGLQLAFPMGQECRELAVSQLLPY